MPKFRPAAKKKPRPAVAHALRPGRAVHAAPKLAPKGRRVSSEIGEPRYPPLRGIMAAGRAQSGNPPGRMLYMICSK